jgi:hypothetical protein
MLKSFEQGFRNSEEKDKSRKKNWWESDSKDEFLKYLKEERESIRRSRTAGSDIEPRQTAVSEIKLQRFGGKEYLHEGDEDPRSRDSGDEYLPIDEIADLDALNPEQALLIKEELQNKMDQVFTNPKVFEKWQAIEEFRATPREENKTKHQASGEIGYNIYNLLRATDLNDQEVLDFKAELQEMIDDILEEIEKEKLSLKKEKEDTSSNSINAEELLSDRGFVRFIFENGGHVTKRGVKDYISKIPAGVPAGTKRELRRSGSRNKRSRSKKKPGILKENKTEQMKEKRITRIPGKRQVADRQRDEAYKQARELKSGKKA